MMAEDPSVLPAVERSWSCNSFPDFAAVCLFIDQFGELLGLHPLDIDRLRQNFEDYSEGTMLF